MAERVNYRFANSAIDDIIKTAHRPHKAVNPQTGFCRGVFDFSFPFRGAFQEE